MASQNSPSRHRSATKGAKPFHCFHGVFRTRRYIATRRRKHGRNPSLINLQQPERERLHFYFSVSFFAIVSSARPTSSSTTENSNVSTDFFGLITTSTEHAPRSTERRNRTASRRRRLIRFRCTAPPSTRPTVNPTRAPFSGKSVSGEAPSCAAPPARRR